MNDRNVIDSLAREFTGLHTRYCSLIRATAEEDLYRQPSGSTAAAISSVGESVIRGAAVVEQTFGGITANLWDDPFEWTLPEHLSTVERLIEYLVEVEATRERAFASFAQDADLLKQIMVPAGETRALIDLLIETLVQTADYCGRALATHSLLAESAAPEPTS